MVRARPHFGAEGNVVVAIIAEILGDDYNPSVFANLRIIPRHVILRELFSDNPALLRKWEWVGDRILYAAIQLLLSRRYPHLAIKFMSSIKHGLTTNVVHTVIACRKGVFMGPVGAGEKGISNIVEAYIGLHLSKLGLQKTLVLIEEIYDELLEPARVAINTWMSKSEERLYDGRSGIGTYQAPEVPTALMDAALRALDVRPLPPDLLTRLPTPSVSGATLLADVEIRYAPTIAIGIDAVLAAVALFLAETWRDVTPLMLEAITGPLLDDHFLRHLPSRIGWTKALAPNDHLLVYIWFGERMTACDEHSMLVFVRCAMMPSIEAAFAVAFPLYLPNGTLPPRPSPLQKVLSPPLQQFLMYYTETEYLGIHHMATPAWRIYEAVPDICNVCAQYEGALEEAMRRDLEDMRAQLDEPIDLIPYEATHCRLVVRGIPAGEASSTTMQERRVRYNVRTLIDDGIASVAEAKFLHLRAPEGVLDGSVYIRVNRQGLSALNLADGEHHTNAQFGGSDITLSMHDDAVRHWMPPELVDLLRSVNLKTLEQRNMLAYRSILQPSAVPLFPPVGNTASMNIFGADVPVRSSSASCAGYVVGYDVPFVPGCAVKFVGSIPFVSPLFSSDQERMVRNYVVRSGFQTCTIVFNQPVTRAFVDNLNHRVQYLGGVRGRWEVVEDGDLYPLVEEIVNERAAGFRFDVGCR